MDKTTNARIMDYRTGETLRRATDEEVALYQAELATLPTGEREVGAVDGAPYGYTQTVYLDVPE